jgi:hypothetical protein
MNDTNLSEATLGPHPAKPTRSGPQPRSQSAMAVLSAAPSLALAALTAAPLTAAIRIAAHFGDSQTAALIRDDCGNALMTGTLHALKWPECAGD